MDKNIRKELMVNIPVSNNIENMDSFNVPKLEKIPNIRVTVPGSKSMTNRALLLAALAEGKTGLSGVAFSEDSRIFIKALQDLGFEVLVDEENKKVNVTGLGGKIPKKEASIYVASAGTASRFLTAFTALSGSKIKIDSSEQMKKRPMEELYEVLESIGISVEKREKDDKNSDFIKNDNDIETCEFKDNKVNENDKNTVSNFPIIVDGSGLTNEKEISINLNIDRSSQFLSALLMVLPLYFDKINIHLTGNRKAKSYVIMTEKMMIEFGFSGQITKESENDYIITGGSYSGRDYNVEPDVSAACYFYALAAITGGSIIVNYVKKDSLQGDLKFLDVLKNMGCEIIYDDEIIVKGPEGGALKGITVSMSDFSDQALTLAAI
ncbi:MAG: 3-phosphoshikimate 1-carboxyvinyltransferase, partial [Lachnospiraceae bacterium]|nr:3-phosphoshikimate 1-carboxyvinyltransferase [Lachnospiraceae bacterium]